MLLVNASFQFYYAHLDDLLAQYDNDVPQELLNRRTADGAKLAFALSFGWAYGLFYALPWLIGYAMFQLAHRGFKTSRGSFGILTKKPPLAQGP